MITNKLYVCTYIHMYYTRYMRCWMLQICVVNYFFSLHAVS